MAVRRSDALHRTLTANLPDTSVFLLDRDLRILIADGEAIRRLPWSDEDMFRGRLVAELAAMVPADVLELSLATYRAALEGERASFEFASDGLTFAVQAVPVRADDGTVESVLVVARDITRADARRGADRAPRPPAARRRRARPLRAPEPGPRRADGRGGDDGARTLGVDGGGVLELSEDGEP